MAEENIIEPKESRADFRYVPLCKPLIQVMCLPKNEKEREVFTDILTHYINTNNAPD